MVRRGESPHFLLLRFIKGGMNIIDLLGILPYFASLILSLLTTSSVRGGGRSSNQYQDEMRRIAQVCCPTILSPCLQVSELNS